MSHTNGGEQSQATRIKALQRQIRVLEDVISELNVLLAALHLAVVPQSPVPARPSPTVRKRFAKAKAHLAKRKDMRPF